MKKALKMLVFGIIVWALCEGSSCAGEKWQLEKVSGGWEIHGCSG